MAARKKKTSKSGNSNRNQDNTSFIKTEAIIIGLFVISVLLFLSNFKICGVVGNFFRSIQLGLFGVMGYLFPIVLFMCVLFGLSNKGNTKAILKIVATVFALLCLCSLIHLFFGRQFESFESFGQFFTDYKAGGLIGGAIAAGFKSVLGSIGATLVLVAAFIISCVCITEKSFVSVVKSGSDKAYRHAKEDIDRRKVEHEKRAEERKLAREEATVEGIDLASTDLSASDDIMKEAQSKIAAKVSNMSDSDDDFATPYDDVDAQSQADVFSGSIVKPPEYDDDDSVPFVTSELKEAFKKADDILAKKKYPDPTADAYYQTTIDTIDTDGQPVSLESSDGERTIVTATGKVIEADTDAVQKKMTQAQKETAVGEVSEEIKKRDIPKKPYIFPSFNLLEKGKRVGSRFSDKEYKETAIKLQKTLQNFGVSVTVTNISCGPVVTRYELHPEQGVKVSKVVNLADDIKLSLAASDIRIEAPIPGKSAIGIEVPNKENNTVFLRDLLDTPDFKENNYKIAFAVGKDIGGQVVVTDLAKMPHLLIAGATGSGKSVCINTLIMSIIYKYKPEEVKLMMIDPKVVELSVYNGIPHLLIPVVTDPKKAAGALNWAVAEMMDRYKKFENAGKRDLKGYNEKVDEILASGDMEEPPEKLPQIVIIVDELADLMMVAQSEVEEAICRLAQLARAAGIHLVIATQRPSVNVITGLIKANIPSRIAFAVSSGVDSRTILDGIGAEKLLGKGDMLFSPQGAPKPQRIQGAFISDKEVQKVVEFIRKQDLAPEYDAATIEKIASTQSMSPNGSSSSGASDRDELFAQAGRFIIEKDKASIGNLQRMFKIGFNRAARIMDQLCDAGVVGEEQGTKPREILMTEEEFEQII